MNLLRLIFPLRLRELVYFRLPFSVKNDSDFPLPAKLAFAPSSLAVLHPSDYGHRQIGWLGFYDLELTRSLSKLANEGGVFVDVGANAGYFTAMWVAAKEGNRAIAIEASPRNHPMLRQNISAMTAGDHVELHECAVGEVAGEMPFEIGPPEQTGWGGFSNSRASQSVSVAVKTLDEILERFERIAAIKIDTEGADTWVIKGVKRILAEHRVDHIFYEQNSTRMKELGIERHDAEAFLESLGYRVTHLDGDQFHARPSRQRS
jgi:FkbM family methyltransferase